MSEDELIKPSKSSLYGFLATGREITTEEILKGLRDK
jgi:hypothetical protein